MASEDVASRLEDILDAAESVRQFVAGRSLDDYRTNTMLRLAIERCIEVISEASRHDIGNVLRHAYQSVDPQIIWEVATHHLTGLRAAVEQTLREIDAGGGAI